MAQSAAAQPPLDPFDSFHIFEGGQEDSHNIYNTKHHLFTYANFIRCHAWKGQEASHQNNPRGCKGVADVVNKLVNELIIGNAPLASEGRRLATLIGGLQAEAQSQAFRNAAQAHRSVNWSIDERTVTLIVPIKNADRNLFAQQDAPSPLSLDNNNLVLTLSYQEGLFLSLNEHPRTFLVGDLCQMAIGQVRHAIDFYTHANHVGDVGAAASQPAAPAKAGTGRNMPPSHVSRTDGSDDGQRSQAANAHRGDSAHPLGSGGGGAAAAAPARPSSNETILHHHQQQIVDLQEELRVLRSKENPDEEAQRRIKALENQIAILKKALTRQTKCVQTTRDTLRKTTRDTLRKIEQELKPEDQDDESDVEELFCQAAATKGVATKGLADQRGT